MNLPFSVDEFLGVFEKYNLSVWPAQIFLIILAFGIISMVALKNKGNFVLILLGVLWTWTGVAYHLVFFSEINSAAYIFGGMFILQGIAFILYGLFSKQKPETSLTKDAVRLTGMFLILYALGIYPFLAGLLGHSYPKMPTFGLPCPTTIFTFGILLFFSEKIPWYLIVIPFLWSLVGFSAALQLSIYEDFGLVFAGLIGGAILLIKHKNSRLVTSG